MAEGNPGKRPDCGAPTSEYEGRLQRIKSDLARAAKAAEEELRSAVTDEQALPDADRRPSLRVIPPRSQERTSQAWNDRLPQLEEKVAEDVPLQGDFL